MRVIRIPVRGRSGIASADILSQLGLFESVSPVDTHESDHGEEDADADTGRGTRCGNGRACALAASMARGMTPPACSSAAPFRFLPVGRVSATGREETSNSKLFKKLFIVHSVRPPQFFRISTAQDAAP